MIKMSDGEKITEDVRYKIEFSKASEVAELGEHAPKQLVGLPSNFDLNNEEMKVKALERAKEIMEQWNYDTMVIQKETYEEFVYFKEN